MSAARAKSAICRFSCSTWPWMFRLQAEDRLGGPRLILSERVLPLGTSEGTSCLAGFDVGRDLQLSGPKSCRKTL